MKTIYKYEIPLNDSVTIEMPEGAKIISLQVQRGKPYIWALVTKTNPIVKRMFLVVLTGHDGTDDSFDDYIGTFQIHDGHYVYHLFELKERA